MDPYGVLSAVNTPAEETTALHTLFVGDRTRTVYNGTEVARTSADDALQKDTWIRRGGKPALP